MRERESGREKGLTWSTDEITGVGVSGRGGTRRGGDGL